MRQQQVRRGIVGKTAAAIFCTVLVSGTAVTQAEAAPALKWTEASPGRPNAVLSDIDSKAGATWAVGTDLIDGFADVRPLVMRWQGGKWHVAPQPVRKSMSLNSVSVGSATNVWAVGEDRSSEALQQLVMHWDGKVWKVVPGPKVSTGGLSDVQVAADGTVWVSGWANVAGSEHAAVYRYDGKNWQALTTGLENAINGNTLAVLSKNNAWLGLNGGLAHFDGTSWKPVTMPANSVPTGLAVGGPKDIWLAGIDQGSGVPIGASLLMHYDGKTWKRIPAPKGSTQLYDLVLRSGSPVAVGEAIDPATFNSQPLVLTYNGKAFVKAASPTTKLGTLAGAAVVGTQLWTVGNLAQPTTYDAYAAYAK